MKPVPVVILGGFSLALSIVFLLTFYLSYPAYVVDVTTNSVGEFWPEVALLTFIALFSVGMIVSAFWEARGAY